jgi:hypothetical protein
VIETFDFAGQNWVIRPVAVPVPSSSVPIGPHGQGGSIPTSGESDSNSQLTTARGPDQRWELTLTGVVVVNIAGTSDGRAETVGFEPNTTDAMAFAMQRYGIHAPATTPYGWFVSSATGPIFPVLQVEQWAPFVAVSSFFDANSADNMEFTVDTWRPAPFGSLFRTDPISPSTPEVHNIFTGISVDVGVRDSDATLLRLSYHITLLGRMFFATGVGRV